MTSLSIASRRTATEAAPRKCSIRPASISDHKATRACSRRRRDQAPSRLERGAEMRDVVPDLGDAGAFERRHRAHRHRPLGQPRADQAERVGIVGGRALRRFGEFAVGLVDEDQIGQFDDAALQPLQFVAGRRRQDQHEHVDHLGDRGLALPGADGLDDDRVEAGRLAQRGSPRGCRGRRRRGCLRPRTAG